MRLKNSRSRASDPATWILLFASFTLLLFNSSTAFLSSFSSFYSSIVLSFAVSRPRSAVIFFPFLEFSLVFVFWSLVFGLVF